MTTKLLRKLVFGAAAVLASGTAFAYSQLAYDTCGYYYGQDTYPAKERADSCVSGHLQASQEVCLAATGNTIDAASCSQALMYGSSTTSVNITVLPPNVSINHSVAYSGGYAKQCADAYGASLESALSNYNDCLSKTDWDAAGA